MELQIMGSIEHARTIPDVLNIVKQWLGVHNDNFDLKRMTQFAQSRVDALFRSEKRLSNESLIKVDTSKQSRIEKDYNEFSKFIKTINK